MTDRLDPQPWMTAAPTRAVMDALEAAGGSDCARFVGGCVRDTLVGRPVADIDIATRLTPEATLAALKAGGLGAVPTGVAYGTVTAIADHRPFEITTLRRDVETDGRRAVVAFTIDWAEDAARRDFRLNAVYLDRQGRLYDPVGGGVEDAHAGRIVFVGDAETRIREDYLRVLRFFRFTAWYGRGEPDAAGLAACAALKQGTAGLSGERVSKELLRLLAAPDPRAAVGLMAGAGVLAVVLPVLLRIGRFEAMVPIDPDPERRLSALLPDDPETVLAAAERLRLSNALRDRLLLAAAAGPDLSISDAEARAALYREGAAFGDRVMKRWAEQPGAEADARRLLALSRDWPPPRFPLTGKDIASLGVPVGPEVGRRLREAEAWWVAQDFVPDRATLLAWIEAGAR
ncbi:MAG TPA: CCA tRNA nucleotidyltransferase [Caulobacteraceae bacterium]|jgi:poly(A) polymerase|nr:CCA tRNA nucleotidyltransferase [Caulobacteraceae bacterium]